ncbi:MAG: O-antigen/teichoic acid export membrane protein [Flavobacteriales bacterium]|jgi:O-antigen/teichoic acid export membrane protein
MFTSLIKKSPLFQKILVTMSGSLIAQIIALSASPIITRLYGPEEFGYFSNVSALATVLVSLLTLSYSMIVVLPKRAVHSEALVKFTCAFATLNALIFCAFNFFFDTSQYIHIGNVSFYELVVLAYFLAIFEVVTFWLLKKEYFTFRATLLIIQAIIITVLKVSLGYIFPDETSLVYSTIIGLLVVNIIIFMYSDIKFTLNNKMVLQGWFCVKRYADIAKYRTPQNMLANFNLLLPILMLTYLYNAEVAGMYALARTVLLLPGNLISKSVADVLFPKLSIMFNEKKQLGALVSKFVFLLSIIGLIPLLTLFFWGENLFLVVFGERWANAGTYAQWLCVWLYFNFINKPYVTLIPILKLEKVFLKNSLLNTVLATIGLYAGFYFYDNAIYSIALFSLCTVIPQIIIFVITHKKMSAYDNSIKNIKA